MGAGTGRGKENVSEEDRAAIAKDISAGIPMDTVIDRQLDRDWKRRAGSWRFYVRVLIMCASAVLAKACWESL
jgi:hypothetical protein